MKKPTLKPIRPRFGSGPTCKRPGWSPDVLNNALVGRSHRTPDGLERLSEVISLIHSVLELPKDYQVAIVPGSGTGAIEGALWNTLGHRGVDIFAWELFGKIWLADIVEQLRIEDVRLFDEAPGSLPDLSQYDPARDVVFVYNGTTSGVCVPNLDWIPHDREGLAICDATSAAFCFDIDWSKLDLTTFSWQKGLGGEAAHGVVVMSPRAIAHIKSYMPSWPIPRLFRYRKKEAFIDEIFKGAMVNTPSLLCVEDCRDTLTWLQSIGGLSGALRRVQNNFDVVDQWIGEQSWIHYLAADRKITSPTSMCFRFLNATGKISSEAAQRARADQIAQLLAAEEVAFDIRNHRYSAPGLRIWGGPTVEAEDLKRLLPWITWANAQVIEGI